TVGNLVSITNALGHQATWSLYNGLGQAGRMVDANGVATDFAYDAKGNLTSSTQYLVGGNRLATFTYNNDHQMTDAVYADGSAPRLRYTASGRLEYVGNALSEFARIGFDVPTITRPTTADRKVPSLSGSVPVGNALGQFSTTRRLDSLGRAKT